MKKCYVLPVAPGAKQTAKLRALASIRFVDANFEPISTVKFIRWFDRDEDAIIENDQSRGLERTQTDLAAACSFVRAHDSLTLPLRSIPAHLVNVPQNEPFNFVGRDLNRFHIEIADPLATRARAPFVEVHFPNPTGRPILGCSLVRCYPVRQDLFRSRALCLVSNVTDLSLPTLGDGEDPHIPKTMPDTQPGFRLRGAAIGDRLVAVYPPPSATARVECEMTVVPRTQRYLLKVQVCLIPPRDDNTLTAHQNRWQEILSEGAGILRELGIVVETVVHPAVRPTLRLDARGPFGELFVAAVVPIPRGEIFHNFEVVAPGPDPATPILVGIERLLHLSPNGLPGFRLRAPIPSLLICFVDVDRNLGGESFPPSMRFLVKDNSVTRDEVSNTAFLYPSATGTTFAHEIVHLLLDAAVPYGFYDDTTGNHFDREHFLGAFHLMRSGGVVGTGALRSCRPWFVRSSIAGHSLLVPAP